MDRHNKTNKKFVTAKWLTENMLLGVSKNTIYKWAWKGIIPAYRVGRTLLFDLDEVIEAIKEKAIIDENRVNEIITRILRHGN